MAKRKINKSQKVRDYLTAHPDVGPKKVAQALKQYGITPGFVSNVKVKMKKIQEGNGKPNKRGRPAGSTKTADACIDSVIAAATFIGTCGSIEEARRALQVAEEIVSAAR